MPTVEQKFFSQDQIKAIAKSLGDTKDGLTGSEIAHLLQQAKILDIGSANTKWIRLHDAFCKIQNSVKNRTNILEFIRRAMKPANFLNRHERYEILRAKLNGALAFCGLEVKETGELVTCKSVSTLTEAEERANRLKITLQERDIHPEVLKFCRAELLDGNYFHAVLEAVKSIFDKLRRITNSGEDGHRLADASLAGNDPIIKINSLRTKSEKSEQIGFLDLVKGVYSMFRNPLINEGKINWEVAQKDAEDLLTLVSMIHRRIDMAMKQ